MIQIEIDNGSGFCFGVTTAIRKAEEELAKGGTLYCLGDIVHNSVEVQRLTTLGLITIDHDQLRQLHGVKVLLRAHGEPPETYALARKNNIEIIDATCPVVLQLQKRIRMRNEELGMRNEELEMRNEELETPNSTLHTPHFTLHTSHPTPHTSHSTLHTSHSTLHTSHSPQIVIFGKRGHAEVLGLVGQTQGRAIIIEHFDDVKKLDLTRDIYLYSQTTKSLDEYHRIIDYIQAHIAPERTFQSFDTICRQVANRMTGIADFAARHDLVLFVAGRKSSNGRVLFQECLNVNPNAHQIENADEIDTQWLNTPHTIGICGATSTPKWLMEECREYIIRYQHHRTHTPASEKTQRFSENL